MLCLIAFYHFDDSDFSSVHQQIIGPISALNGNKLILKKKDQSDIKPIEEAHFYNVRKSQHEKSFKKIAFYKGQFPSNFRSS